MIDEGIKRKLLRRGGKKLSLDKLSKIIDFNIELLKGYETPNPIDFTKLDEETHEFIERFPEDEQEIYIQRLDKEVYSNFDDFMIVEKRINLNLKPTSGRTPTRHYQGKQIA